MKKEIPWNLIIQKLKHDITAEEEHDLTVWLAEDNHRVIFEELQTLWQKVQENAINYTPDTNYYWKELSKRMKTTEVKAEPCISGGSRAKRSCCCFCFFAYSSLLYIIYRYKFGSPGIKYSALY